MTFDLSIKLLTAGLAPIVAVIVFLLKDGHKRARFAARAKTAADLLSATPHDSRNHQSLSEHLEYELARYLDATQPPTKNYTKAHLALASITGPISIFMGFSVWILYNPGYFPGFIEEQFRNGSLSIEWKTGIGISAAALFLYATIHFLIAYLRMSAELRFHRAYSLKARGLRGPTSTRDKLE